ncbi:hypothetical protein [Natronorubrum texcoconense]|uniref:Uncharacterized protein n=1 Tax=Natronorubrum texcoconense TaxID=1095776 RepID=A0A1G9GI57_9EURY|nr:hypothetical protein [Natronorubrum texcoconense]SDL00195.1 hypothetical protein SAMN04515672_4508 [Natronorubrum texcoconense]
MTGCESREPCVHRASHRIGVRHATGERIVYWHYCLCHFRAEMRRLDASTYFDVVDVGALS